MKTYRISVAELLKRFESGCLVPYTYNPAVRIGIRDSIAKDLSINTLRGHAICIGGDTLKGSYKNAICAGHTRVEGLLLRKLLGLLTTEESAVLIPIQECETEEEFQELLHRTNQTRNPGSTDSLNDPNTPGGKIIRRISRGSKIHKIDNILNYPFLFGPNNYLSVNLLNILFLWEDSKYTTVDLTRFSKGSHHRKTSELAKMIDGDPEINDDLVLAGIRFLNAYADFLLEGIEQKELLNRNRTLDELVGFRVGQKKRSPGFFALFAADFLGEAAGGFSKKSPKRLWQHLRTSYNAADSLSACRSLVRRESTIASLAEIRKIFRAV